MTSIISQPYRSKSYKYSDLRKNLIKDYSKSIMPHFSDNSSRNHRSTLEDPLISFNVNEPQDQTLHYDVKISDVIVINKVAFYKIQIVDSNAQILNEIARSYDDFKDFHQQIKKIFKSDEMVDLPNKGNLGIFASEQQIQDFRKFSLQVYLKFLFGSTNISENELFKGFVGLL